MYTQEHRESIFANPPSVEIHDKDSILVENLLVFNRYFGWLNLDVLTENLRFYILNSTETYPEFVVGAVERQINIYAEFQAAAYVIRPANWSYSIKVFVTKYRILVSFIVTIDDEPMKLLINYSNELAKKEDVEVQTAAGGRVKESSLQGPTAFEDPLYNDTPAPAEESPAPVVFNTYYPRPAT